jgi:hypothetical protein
MYVVRDILHCKPGKVRALVEKFKMVSAVAKRLGIAPPRILTDAGGMPFWTLVLEFEAETIDAFAAMEGKVMSDPEIGGIMAGYHDLVEGGRREFYRVEG